MTLRNALLMAAAAVAVTCSPALMLLGQGPPQAGEAALVIAPPWGASAAEIAAKSGVWEVAPERAPMGALVMLEHPQNVDSLYRQGAWLVLNGKKVLELCVI